MPEQEAESRPKLSLSQVEEAVHEHALKYAREHTSLPVTAFRVFLWPGDFHCKLTPGPTARIILGSRAWPGEPDFWDTLKRAVDRVWSQRLYSTLAIESVAHILQRDASMRRWWKEKYNFDPELIPHMLGDDEIVVRQIERIEVVHPATGMREVVEVEPGAHRSTYAARDIAKTRLARRVNEQRLADAAKQKDNEIPFPKMA